MRPRSTDGVEAVTSATGQRNAYYNNALRLHVTQGVGHDSARRQYERSIRVDPHPSALNNLALLLKQQGRGLESLDMSVRALQLDGGGMTWL